MEAKTYSDIEKMAVRLTDDPSIVEGMRKHHEATLLVWVLTSMRNANGLNQKQLAEKMGISTSKISRFEDTADDNLKFGDIRAYVKALGMNMSILFDSTTLPAAQRIKQHIFAVHALLEKLCEISKEAGESDEITRKIKEFYGDVLFNFLLGFEKNVSQLPTQEPLRFLAEETRNPVDVTGKTLVRG